MSGRFSELAARFQNPEYTGANRCIFCTILNLGIAIVVGVLLYSVSRYLAALVFVAFAITIYLRGYLIPGTPWLTQRLLPDPLFSHIKNHSQRGPQYSVTELASEITPGNLADSSSDETDRGISSTSIIQEAIQERIKEFNESSNDGIREAIGSVLDISPDSVNIREYPNDFMISIQGEGAVRWVSRTAFLFDLATILEYRSHGRDEIRDIQDLNQRFAGLRSQLDRCPRCKTELELEETQSVVCCGASTVMALLCPECNTRLFEAEKQ